VLEFERVIVKVSVPAFSLTLAGLGEIE